MSVPRDRQVLIASNALDLTRTEGPSSIYNLAARILSHGKVIKNVRLGGGPHSLKVYMIFFYSCPCAVAFIFVDPPPSSSTTTSSSTITTTTTTIAPHLCLLSLRCCFHSSQSLFCVFLICALRNSIRSPISSLYYYFCFYSPDSSSASIEPLLHQSPCPQLRCHSRIQMTF